MKLEKKIRRYKLIEVHQHLVREGNLLAARKLLKFLRDGNVTLGLSDIDNDLERIVEKAGCKLTYGRNYSCRAYL